jgi:plastocyanin
MTRIYGLAAALVAASVVAASASSMSLATLKGTVGPGFTISLKSSSGAAVKTLKHGPYTFVVSDKSSSHNFFLKGPGVSKAITSIGGTGTKTVTVTLKPGTYKFMCQAHPTSMFGSFRVT